MIAPPEIDQELRVRRRVARSIRRSIQRTERLGVLEWAEKYRRLAKETTQEGPWRSASVPYCIGPLKALSTPGVREVAVIKSAQSGATEGVLLNWLFRNIDLDPGPTLLLFPTNTEAEKFSKKKLTPASRATPRMRGRLADPGERTGENTILEKSFPGGSLGLIGGSSSRGLRMITSRYYGGDDIDSLDEQVDEGDQISLLRKRAKAVWNAQGVWISSPSDEGSSRIQSLYDEMERSGEFHVPCPHCDEMQVLRDPTMEIGANPEDTPYGLKWEKDEAGEHLPATTCYLCEHCGTLIEERHRWSMIQRGEYLDRDGVPLLDVPARSYGFHWSDLVVPWVSWRSIVEGFLADKDDPVKRKVFVNTVLGRPYQEPAVKVSTTELAERAERYMTPDGTRIEVPDGVGKIVGFGDVQHDRIEVLVRGFGANEESWMIGHWRLHGDTSLRQVWEQLEAVRTRKYHHASGTPMRIWAFGVDSGDGSRTSEVYDYVKPRQHEGVRATKGQPARQKDPVRVHKKDKKTGIARVDLGTYPLKAMLFSRLSKRATPSGVPFGYMHFRAPDAGWHNGADREYFEQFGRERREPKKLRNGRIVYEWVETDPNKPNEAIDLEVGCLGMLYAEGDVVRMRLGELAQQARSGPPAPNKEEKGERKRNVRVIHRVNG